MSKRTHTRTPTLTRAALFVSLACTVASACRPVTEKEEGKDSEVLGVGDGNTGQMIQTRNNPWFVGREPATYCIVYGEGTALGKNAESRKFAERAIAGAMEKWKHIAGTLAARGHTGGRRTLNGEFLVGPEAAYLTEDFRQVSCLDKPELFIKIGTFDLEEQEYLHYTSRRTVAFALRQRYSDRTGRGRGILWLAADSGPRRYKGPAPDGAFWGKANYLHNVVLHELGHVFGLPHIPNSVMDQRFPAGVLAGAYEKPWAGTEILSLRGVWRSRCLELRKMSTEGQEARDTLALIGAPPEETKKICWKPGFHDEPGEAFRFSFLDDKGVERGFLKMEFDDVFTQDLAISGQYLKKSGDGHKYAEIVYSYLKENERLPIRFEREGRVYWGYFGRIVPGVFTIKVGLRKRWANMILTSIPLEDLAALEKLLSSVTVDSQTPGWSSH